jgi:hypothetical protein
VVTTSSAFLAANASQVTIHGFGFDPTATNNVVTFNDGAKGAVTNATPTSLTVTFSTRPVTAGSLTAVVTTDNQSSGTPLQVATVTPVVTASTAQLTNLDTTFTIHGFGFDPDASNNSVVISNGGVGKVIDATPTSLTILFRIVPAPLNFTPLFAVVTTDGLDSGRVQLATWINVK